MKTNRTEIFYEIYDFLYREPQHLGKIKNPKTKYDTHTKVMEHLKDMEVTLNHIMNAFFTFLPSRFLHKFFETSLQKPLWIDEYDVFVDSLKNAIGFDTEFTQPDLFFVGNKINVAIEMKIGAKSSLDQLMKYALLFCMEQEESNVEKDYNLIFLGKGDFSSLREEGYTNVDELKNGFSQYTIRDKSAKGDINLINYHPKIKTMVNDMTITYINYGDLKTFCTDTLKLVQNNFQIEKLLKGMIIELEDRKLT